MTFFLCQVDKDWTLSDKGTLGDKRQRFFLCQTNFMEIIRLLKGKVNLTTLCYGDIIGFIPVVFVCMQIYLSQK